MLYQWFSARQISNQTSIACYNAKTLPIVMPISMEKDACRNKTSCFAYCVMIMASWNDESAKQKTLCPRRLDNQFEPWVPPLTVKADGLVHPLCIMRGKRMTKEMTNARNAIIMPIRNSHPNP